MMLRGLFMGTLFAAALLAGAGCGSSKIKTYPVTGNLTLDGTPVPGATISFVPAGEGRAASARTNDDGSFSLTTFNSDDGALAGEYKMVVTYVELATESEGLSPNKMSEKDMKAFFMKAAKGPQRNENKKKATFSIPKLYAEPKTTPLKYTVPVPGPLKVELKSSVR